MKIRNLSKAGDRHPLNAFTILEVCGALAVIAILAIAIIPPTITAMNTSKEADAVAQYQALWAAATNHFGAYGAFNVISSPSTLASATQLASWDTKVLIPEEIMDHPFRIPVGQSNGVHVVTGLLANGGAGYLLNGLNNCTAGKNYVVEIVVTNVTPQNAYDISQILDGGSLTPTAVGAPDNLGRITYDGTNKMYMYVAGF